MFEEDYALIQFYGTYVQVKKPLVFIGKDYRITVKKGMYSDGTTNKGLGWIIPQFGLGLRPALIHDGLVSSPSMVYVENHEGEEVFLNWNEAADVYGECLKSVGISDFRANLIVAGVKLYGKLPKKT